MTIDELHLIFPTVTLEDLPTKMNGATDLQFTYTLQVAKNTANTTLQVTTDRDGIEPTSTPVDLSAKQLTQYASVQDLWADKDLRLMRTVISWTAELLKVIPEVDFDSVEPSLIRKSIQDQVRRHVQEMQTDSPAEGEDGIDTAAASGDYNTDSPDGSALITPENDGVEKRMVRREEFAQNTELYNVYRPLRFSELHGPTLKTASSVINTMVRKALQADPAEIGDPHVPNPYAPDSRAYVFHGDSGSGKTTLPHILSLSLNCEDPQPYGEKGARIEPCLKCDSCLDIAYTSLAGQHTAVRHLSGTSDLAGVDNVREFAAEYLEGQNPLGIMYTVLTINEIHEISAKSIKALLVPLENMGDRRFVFMTSTEPNPFVAVSKNKRDVEAIESRLRFLWFDSWTNNDIALLLADVAAQEAAQAGVTVTSKVIRHLTRMSQGNARRAIQLLAEVIGAAPGATVGIDDLNEILASSNLQHIETSDSIEDLKQAIYTQDLRKAYTFLNSRFNAKDHRNARSVSDGIYYRLTAALSGKQQWAALQKKDLQEVILYARMGQSLMKTYEGTTGVTMNSQALLQNAVTEAILAGKRVTDKVTTI